MCVPRQRVLPRAKSHSLEDSVFELQPSSSLLLLCRIRVSPI
nr:MAG TPA: hypothetical protein [Caudoviricetes sp.]